MNEQLVQLYQEMYEMTEPECRQCRCPHSCCSSEYCELTIEWARESWGVELQRTDHPTLPLMGPSGCTAAPHFRPNCTVHTCDVNGVGCKKDDPDWTEKYFGIRDQIEALEYKRSKS